MAAREQTGKTRVKPDFAGAKAITFDIFPRSGVGARMNKSRLQELDFCHMSVILSSQLSHRWLEAESNYWCYQGARRVCQDSRCMNTESLVSYGSEILRGSWLKTAFTSSIRMVSSFRPAIGQLGKLGLFSHYEIFQAL